MKFCVFLAARGDPGTPLGELAGDMVFLGSESLSKKQYPMPDAKLETLLCAFESR